MRFAQTRQGVDELGDDFLGRGMRHFLDVHAAFAGGDEGNFLRGAVGHQRNVVFLLNVGTVFDVQAANLLAFGAGLMRLELHAQDVASDALDVLNGFGNLHTAALAAATRMNLCFDNPHRATQFLCGFDRLLHRECRNATRNGHAELTQDFFALVLVNFHELVSRNQ